MESFQRLLTVLLILFSSVKAVPEPLMVYAVNYGGSAMTDSFGVQYKEYKKCLNEKWGQSTNVPKADQNLYDTYCFGKSLNFQIPLSGSGKYLMILKFIPLGTSILNGANISLNKKHQIWTNKNTYNIVGDSGVIAYDEYVVFSVCGDELQYKNTYSTIVNSKIDLDITSVNQNYYSQISALVLFKNNIYNFKVQPIAKKFDTDDFIYQAQYECRANKFHKKEATTMTNIITNNNTTTINNYCTCNNQNVKDSSILYHQQIPIFYF
jgi:hypothetical protein